MPAEEAKGFADPEALGLAELVAGLAELVAIGLAELVATAEGFAELVATDDGFTEARGILIVALLEGPIDSKALDKNPVPCSIKNTPAPTPIIIITK